MLSKQTLRRFLVLLLGVTSCALAQETNPEGNVHYNWAFVARSGAAGHRALGIVMGDTTLKSGDQFKMFVNLAKTAFVYVVHKSSNNAISLLFPYGPEMFQKEYSLDKNYYIPKGRDWFALDKNTGTETFYVLASSERLTGLENLLAEYAQADSAKKGVVAARVVDEIKETKKRFRTFVTLAERPISIAGNVRGEGAKAVDPDRVDIATLATEISANNFFSKTITIDHK
jgi:Domain of unknown function (DUF4384)